MSPLLTVSSSDCVLKDSDCETECAEVERAVDDELVVAESSGDCVLLSLRLSLESVVVVDPDEDESSEEAWRLRRVFNAD